jgi:hypothetical protein
LFGLPELIKRITGLPMESGRNCLFFSLLKLKGSFLRIFLTSFLPFMAGFVGCNRGKNDPGAGAIGAIPTKQAVRKIKPSFGCRVYDGRCSYYIPAKRAEDARRLLKWLVLFTPPLGPEPEFDQMEGELFLMFYNPAGRDVFYARYCRGIVEVRFLGKKLKRFALTVTDCQRIKRFLERVRTDIPTLRINLRDPSPKIRRSAAEALERTSAKAGPAVPALVCALKDKDLGVRLAAATALAHMGQRKQAVLAALASDLASPRAAIREKTAAKLEFMSKRLAPEVVPLLLKSLKDESPDVREDVLMAIRETGPMGKPAVPALIKGLQDEIWWIRSNVAYALSGIGPGAKVAVPALIKAMNDPKRKVREAAVYALGKIGPGARAAIPLLTKALADSEMREKAAEALTRIDPKNRKAARILKDIRKKKGVVLVEEEKERK